MNKSLEIYLFMNHCFRKYNSTYNRAFRFIATRNLQLNSCVYENHNIRTIYFNFYITFVKPLQMIGRTYSYIFIIYFCPCIRSHTIKKHIGNVTNLLELNILSNIHIICIIFYIRMNWIYNMVNDWQNYFRPCQGKAFVT